MVKKILLAIVLYVAFLLVLLPAAVVVSLLPLPKGVAISGVSGTLWQGQAQTLVIEGRQLDQVSWDLKFSKLLTGTVAADVEAGGRSAALKLNGELAWSLSGLKVTDLKLETDHNFLFANIRLPFRAEVTGNLTLLLPEYVQGKPLCDSLDGKVIIQNAHVRNQFGSYPLGNVDLNLTCVDGQVQVLVPEDKNQLGLSGTVLVGEAGKVKLDAKIRATDFHSEDMQKALKFLGRQDSDGYYPLVWQGRIPGL